MSVTARRGRHHGGDAGFTLIELLVVMVVMGVLMALAIPSWSHYQNKQDYLNSARTVTSELRQVQLQAVAQETSYRVDFAAGGRTISVYRCDLTPPATTCTYTLTHAVTLPGTAATFSSPSFTQSTGAASTSAYFYARGTASDGSLTLTRTNTGGPTYIVTIEGLTGRVNYS
jgi:prepilin-type N-terminal cleavage/methylation domain-containing protein